MKQPETDIVPEHADGVSFGRLILLYDPSGDEAWNGTMRLVTLIQADVEAAVAVDPLLPEVAWSWLTDALEARSQPLHALGGTVTSTSSVRFGDMAGPPRVHQLELRASWTATTTDLAPHVEAFCEVLAYADTPCSSPWMQCGRIGPHPVALPRRLAARCPLQRDRRMGQPDQGLRCTHLLHLQP